jgi:hypothetical protein
VSANLRASMNWAPKPKAMPDQRIRPVHVLIGVVWLAAVLGCSVLLWRYKSAPGPASAAPPRWPVESTIGRSHDEPTLLLFAHPWCPCTRASIGELAVILSKTNGRVKAHVLFDRPASESDDWTQTELWRSATAIPGVTAHIDADGVEARRFGAKTSGHVVLYDPSGTLLFAGGITNARGHAGDSEGRRAVLSLIATGKANRSVGPTFGCTLDNPELAEKR